MPVLYKSFKFINKLLHFQELTSRRPIRKVTLKRPIGLIRPFREISVKTRSLTFEIATRVFASAENHLLTLKPEIYIRNSQKLPSSISIFSQENTFYGAYETMSVRSDHPRMTHR